MPPTQTYLSSVNSRMPYLLPSRPVPLSFMGGAWLCLHLWDHYEYGRDGAYLREIYPVMKGAAEFFLDTLVPDGSGQFLVTSPSMSPENNHHPDVSICAGPAMAGRRPKNGPMRWPSDLPR